MASYVKCFSIRYIVPGTPGKRNIPFKGGAFPYANKRITHCSSPAGFSFPFNYFVPSFTMQSAANSISHKTIRTLVWSHSLLFELSITIVRDLNCCIVVIYIKIYKFKSHTYQVELKYGIRVNYIDIFILINYNDPC